MSVIDIQEYLARKRASGVRSVFEIRYVARYGQSPKGQPFFWTVHTPLEGVDSQSMALRLFKEWRQTYRDKGPKGDVFVANRPVHLVKIEVPPGVEYAVQEQVALDTTPPRPDPRLRIVELA
ncbi:MAG: hypothetical protein PHT12_02430 [Patescibacteria group bacterium]|nr:hypothetical protein [Patescibacteria group bacterium]